MGTGTTMMPFATFSGSDEAEHRPPTIHYSYPRTLGLEWRKSFVKVALDDAAVEKLDREVANTTAAARTAFGDAVVREAKRGEVHGVHYASFEHAPHDPRVGIDEVTNAVASVLERVQGRERPLGETDLWRRLNSATVRRNAAVLGGEHTLDHLLDGCAQRLIWTGPIHRDLHFENFRLSEGGQLKIIDWYLFEADSPLFLDSAAVALDYTRLRWGWRWPDAFPQVVTGSAELPLAARTRQLIGELSPGEAAAIWAMNKLGDPNLRNDPDRVRMRQEEVDTSSAMLTSEGRG